MENYQKLATRIVKEVGGIDNIIEVTHCLTRLRFKLVNFKLVDIESLKSNEEIITSQQSGGEYQVVIGAHVGDVFSEVIKLVGNKTNQDTENSESNEESISPLNKLINIITKVMTPVLGIMSATGLLQGLVALLVAINVLPNGSGQLIIFRTMANTVLIFLPIFLGLTSARTFKMNEFVGVAIGAALVYPNLETLISGETTALYTLFSNTIFETPIYNTFFGIPIMFPPGGYVSTVLPVIFAVYFASIIEKKLKKFIPDLIGFSVTPALTLMIAFPCTILLIGPISNFAGLLLSSSVTGLYGLSPVISTIFITLIYQPLVVLGLHWPLMPIQLTNFAALGYDPVLVCIWVSTFAQVGAVAAVYLRTKSEKLKALCAPAMVSGMFHIMEPAIYGVTLPVKKRFFFSMLGGVAGGLTLTLLGAKNYTLSGSILGVVGFINPANGDISGLIAVLLAILVAAGVPFVLVYLTFSEKNNEGSTSIEKKIESKNIITSPLKGHAQLLEESTDEIFAKGSLGQGILITPTEGKVFSPFDGKITSFFPTGHALGLTSAEGVELLIHIGVDTVKLNGQYFTPNKSQGETVKKGDLLLTFDVESIMRAGYNIASPIVVTNTDDFLDIVQLSKNEINVGEDLLKYIPLVH